tara:strand:+ start:2184 stop:3911 length:1728 start_codon:yes stop_codon:yes gene_type:complete
MIDFEKYNNKFLIYVLITFFSAYYLFPLLISGFIGDDLYNSQIRGRLFYEDINILEFYYRETISWYWNNGRLFPISMFAYFTFFFLKSALAVKIYIVSLILLNLIIFSKIIYYLTNSKKITLLFYLLILSSFQFRLWHDPILSFHGLIQTLLLFILVSVFSFLKYQESKELKYFEKISLFFFLLSLLTYEVAYVFIGFFFLLDYVKTNSIKKSLYNIRKYIYILSIILILVTIAKVKIYFTGENYYEIVSDNPFNIIRFFWAFFIQLFSSFNLTYSFAHIYKFDISHLKQNFSAYDIFFIIITFILFKFHISKPNIKNLKKILIICFWLWAPVALIVALSSHQKELIEVGLPAVGYLPIYIQYFGSAILIYIFFYKLFEKTQLFKKLIIFIFPLVLTASAYMHLLTNREVVNLINNNEVERIQMQKILKSGILNKLNNGDLIIREMNKPHDWMWFYAEYTKKRFVFCDLNKNYLEFCYPYHPFNEIKKMSNKKKIYFIYNKVNKYSGEYSFLLGEMQSINLEKKLIEKINLNNIKYYDNKTGKIIHIKNNLNNKFLFKINELDLNINNIIKNIYQ